MRLIRSLWAAGLLAAMSGLALAEPPSPPPFYAITNVDVVTGVGQTLEDATVLVADGLIEAVGVGLTIPGDAWVIDGTGLTVYPGLIDAMTSVGLEVPPERPPRASQPERPTGPVSAADG